jgi:hypothetical protein
VKTRTQSVRKELLSLRQRSEYPNRKLAKISDVDVPVVVEVECVIVKRRVED